MNDKDETQALRLRPRDRMHPGVAAVLEENRKALKAGTIDLRQAATVRLLAKRNPQRLADDLEEIRAVHMESLEGEAAMRDWTPEDWNKFIGGIFGTFIENLPTLLAICG